MGLKIVARIAALHRACFALEETADGMSAKITF
ncbi:hypothetical protein LPU83_pLPU83d_0621 (plasmid) [Rhizobium favelukesii]|uniref:Uncharacterized protein n=1 Tax=Rhizobium favelukesii TaxID=348824 RepID=W6RLL4_9HYPH|nr:hypothetical protein LPU83_pLPU83d_0621 [Rhizobium favelukesii]